MEYENDDRSPEEERRERIHAAKQNFVAAVLVIAFIIGLIAFIFWALDRSSDAHENGGDLTYNHRTQLVWPKPFSRAFGSG